MRRTSITKGHPASILVNLITKESLTLEITFWQTLPTLSARYYCYMASLLDLQKPPPLQIL